MSASLSIKVLKMTKETAVKAAQLLELIDIADQAIDELYNRDAISELPSTIQKELVSVVETYQNSLKAELEKL